mgnify:FL=1
MLFVGWSETMALYAYLPELPNDESVLNRCTLTFAAALFVSMVLYLGSIVGILAAVGYTSDKDTLDDKIGTARLSQSVSFGFAVVFFSISLGWLFQPRPPSRQLAEGESILRPGFRQIYSTAVKVHLNELR